MLLTHEHAELRRTVERFCREELNPHVDAWEDAGAFPAHEVFRKLGQLGLLGLTKPESVGGAALDYSYAVVLADPMGRHRERAASLTVSSIVQKLEREETEPAQALRRAPARD